MLAANDAVRLAFMATSIAVALASACASSTAQESDAGAPDCATPSSAWTTTPAVAWVEDVAVAPTGDIAIAGVSCGDAMPCVEATQTVALIDPDGAMRWAFHHGTAGWRPTVAAASDGAIAAGEPGGVVVLEPSGTPRFERRVAGACQFDVGVDALGRVYAGGVVYAAADLGTGTAVRGVVLVSYDRDGGVRWVRVVQPDGATDCGRSETRIATGGDGTTVIAKPGVLASFAPDGTERWRKVFNVQELHALAVGGAGHVVVGGVLAWGSQRDLGTGDLGIPVNYDGFVASYDDDGAPRWSRRLASLDFDYVYGVAVDDAENVYVTGHFDGGTLDLGGATLTGDGEHLFAASYDSRGALRWARQVDPGFSVSHGRGVAAGACGTLVLGGLYSGTVTFLDGSSSTATVNSAFVTRFVP